MAATIKSSSQIAAMREGGKMLAFVLNQMKKQSASGQTPIEMALIAKNELKKLGGEPAFLGFQGFPSIICISVNNQVQHSIPTDTPLKNGDVVNYDFGVKYRGMVTDGGITIAVGGQTTKDTRRLINGTETALMDGISKVKSGAYIGDISSAIETQLKKHQLGIVQELVGHGVGYQLHEEPEIPNYGRAGRGEVLVSGMTIAIEPIANLGGHRIVGDIDGWTLWTEDGSYSAQFEHTVLVTDTGYEILTSL